MSQLPGFSIIRTLGTASVFWRNLTPKMEK